MRKTKPIGAGVRKRARTGRREAPSGVNRAKQTQFGGQDVRDEAKLGQDGTPGARGTGKAEPSGLLGPVRLLTTNESVK